MLTEECLETLSQIMSILSEMNESINEAWGKSSGMDDASLERRNVKSKTVNMSPDEYIKRASRLVGDGTYKARPRHVKSVEDHRTVARHDVEDYKEKISNPDKEIDIPYLRYDKEHRGQEGLHRAVAAKELGHKSIPVKIYHSTEKDGNMNRGDKKRRRAKLAQIKATEREDAKRRKQEEKEAQERRAHIARDREAHPEKYKDKGENTDISKIFWK